MTTQAFTTLSQLLTENDDSAYWLIDPTLDDPSLTVPELASCIKHPLTIQHPDSASINGPYLAICPTGLAGNRLHDAMLDLALVEAGKAHEPGVLQPRSVAALLLTQQTIADLAAGLGHASVVRDAQGKIRIFRYWDPRVTSSLIGTPSLSNLFPKWLRSVRWAHVTDGGHLQIHRLEGAPAPSTGHSLALRLTGQQETALRTLSMANQVKGLLNTGALAMFVSAKSALDAVKAIERTALTQEEDIVSLATERLKQACAIESTSRIQDLVAQCVQLRLPLSAMLAELDHQDWSSIQASTQEPIRA